MPVFLVKNTARGTQTGTQRNCTLCAAYHLTIPHAKTAQYNTDTPHRSPLQSPFNDWQIMAGGLKSLQRDPPQTAHRTAQKIAHCAVIRNSQFAIRNSQTVQFAAKRNR